MFGELRIAARSVLGSHDACPKGGWVKKTTGLFRFGFSLFSEFQSPLGPDPDFFEIFETLWVSFSGFLRFLTIFSKKVKPFFRYLYFIFTTFHGFLGFFRFFYHTL